MKMVIGGNLFSGIIQEMDISQLLITMRYVPTHPIQLKSEPSIFGLILGLARRLSNDTDEYLQTLLS